LSSILERISEGQNDDESESDTQQYNIAVLNTINLSISTYYSVQYSTTTKKIKKDIDTLQ